MPAVVFEMRALRFEGIVVFLLDFPAGAARRHEGCHGFGGEWRLRQEGLVVELGPRRSRERECTPIDREGIGAGA